MPPPSKHFFLATTCYTSSYELIIVYLSSGKCYLIDVGYLMQQWFFKKYPYTKYHIPSFERSNQVVLFRGHLEFGRKGRPFCMTFWRTLSKKQINIIIVIVALHNYIQHPSLEYIDFNIMDKDLIFILP